MNKDLPLLLTIFGITLISVLGISSLFPLMPYFPDMYGVPKESAVLAISIFSLSGLIFAPFIGIASDTLSKKKLILFALILFTLTGLACFFTRNWTLFLVLRFVQGIAAGTCNILNMILIVELFPKEKHSRYIGYNVIVLTLGTAVFPALGGGFSLLGNFYPFLLSLLTLPTIFLILRYFPKLEEKPKTVSPKAYFANFIQSLNLSFLLPLFLAVFILFFLLSGTLIAAFPLFAEQKFQTSSFHIGLIFSLASLCSSLFAFFIFRMKKQLTFFQKISLASLTYIIASALFLSFTSFYSMFLPILLFGFAQGLAYPSCINLLLNNTKMELNGAYMALNGLVLRASQSIAPVFCSYLFLEKGSSTLFIFSIILAVIFFIDCLFIKKYK